MYQDEIITANKIQHISECNMITIFFNSLNPIVRNRNNLDTSIHQILTIADNHGR